MIPALLAAAPYIVKGVKAILPMAASMLTGTVAASIADKMTSSEPTPEAIAQIKSQVEAYAAGIQQKEGIPMEEAHTRAMNEIGTLLQEKAKGNPSVLANIAAFTVGMIPGQMLGSRLAGKIGPRIAAGGVPLPKIPGEMPIVASANAEPMPKLPPGTNKAAVAAEDLMAQRPAPEAPAFRAPSESMPTLPGGTNKAQLAADDLIARYSGPSSIAAPIPTLPAGTNKAAVAAESMLGARQRPTSAAPAAGPTPPVATPAASTAMPSADEALQAAQAAPQGALAKAVAAAKAKGATTVARHTPEQKMRVKQLGDLRALRSTEEFKDLTPAEFKAIMAESAGPDFAAGLSKLRGMAGVS